MQYACILGKIAKVVSGFAFKSSEFCDSGIPVIKIGNIKLGNVDLSSSQFVGSDYLSSINSNFKVHPNDILISLTGSHVNQPNSVVGRVARYPRGYPVALLNQRAGKVIITEPKKCDSLFLFYHLFDDNVRKDIASFAHGAANQANVSPSQIESLKIFLPPLPIQRKIASILSAYDDLIENNLRRIKILEEMAQNLYREWFVKFRFPGHEKVRFVNSKLGKTPEGWEVRKLGDLVKIRKGQVITKKTIAPGSIPVVAGGIKPAYYHNRANTKHPVVTISASGANAGYVCLYHEAIWASDCSVIDRGATDNVYFFYLQLKERQNEITRLQRGAAQPHVYPKDLMEIDAVEVPAPILKSFNEEAAPVLLMVRNLSFKNQILRQTRDLLLPKLISGELDLSELHIDVPEEAEV